MNLYRKLLRAFTVEGDIKTKQGLVHAAADIVATQAGFMFGAMLPIPQPLKPYTTIFFGAVAPEVIEWAAVGYIEQFEATPGLEDRMKLFYSTDSEYSDYDYWTTDEPLKPRVPIPTGMMENQIKIDSMIKKCKNGFTRVNGICVKNTHILDIL